MNNSLYKQNLRLSIPIMLSSFGQNLVQIVDTLMVGRLGTVSLAAVSFAFAVTYNALVVGMGISMGLTPLVGQNYGKKNTNAIISLFQNSLLLNAFVSLVLVGVLLLLVPFLDIFSQPKEVVCLCKPYYIIVTLSFIPMMIFLTFKQWLEGIGDTKISMIITICANILNIFGNWIFIFGKLGFPAMGVFGAGLSTFISRLLSPIAFYIYIKRNVVYNAYLSAFNRTRLSLHTQKRLIQISFPIAGQMFIEFFALFGITIMMGWVSTAALAAYQIVNTMISTTFLTASGICSAITVLVSHAWGKNDIILGKQHFYTGWKMVVIIMGVFALCFIFFGKYIAMLFSQDKQVIAICSELFIVCGFFQLFDGTQVTGLSGLRAINDVVKPMIYAIVSYLFVALPFAYVCGFIFHIGTWSILAGFMAGLMCAGILYHTRFHRTINRRLKIIRGNH